MFGLKNSCQTVVAGSQPDTFITGTCGTDYSNEIYLLKFAENNLVVVDSFSIKPAILSIDSFYESEVIATSTVSNDEASVQIFSLGKDLEERNVATAKLKSRPIRIQTDKLGEMPNNLVSFDQSTVRMLDLGKSELISESVINIDNRLEAGCWSMLNKNQVALAIGRDIEVFDFRQKNEGNESAISIPNAHLSDVTALEFDSNRGGLLYSGGKDGIMNLWDLRMVIRGESDDNNPLTVSSILAHRHWVKCISIHPTHPSLVLTGSSDMSLRLWEMKENKGLLASFDSNEDTVGSVAWSSGDGSIFASAILSGEMIIQRVPDKEWKRVRFL